MAEKRCGHRPNKAIVSVSEMCDRIKAAVDAKTDDHFVVMARTDALAVDGFEAVLDRVSAFVEAGADDRRCEFQKPIFHHEVGKAFAKARLQIGELGHRVVVAAAMTADHYPGFAHGNSSS